MSTEETIGDNTIPIPEISDLNNNTVVCFYLETKNSIRYVGLCIYNANTNEFSLCEFLENDHFTILESILIQCRPYILLFCKCNDNLDYSRIKLIINLCEIKYKELAKSDFQTTQLENDLNKLLIVTGDVKSCFSLFDLQLAYKALSCIIKHMHLLNDECAINKCVLKNYNINRYMKLDKAAIVALNIHTESKSSNSGNNKNKQTSNSITLYKFLNKCKTKIGERKLLKWVLHPIKNEKKINIRLDMVEMLKEEDSIRSMIMSDHLRKVCDLELITKKLKIVNNNVTANTQNYNNINKNNTKVSKYKNVCTLEDLVRLYETIIISRTIFYCLDEHKGKFRQTLEEHLLNPLKSSIGNVQSFLQLIELTIDFNEVEKHNYLISRKFDEELEKLAKEKDEIYEIIKHHRSEVEDDINYLKGCSKKNASKEDIKLIDCNTNTFLFRAVKKDFNYLQQRKKTYIQVRMNKNEILFQTNKLKSLCQKYEQILIDYNLTQQQLSNKTIEVASSYWEPIVKLTKLLSKIDIYCSFAFICSTSLSSYVRPIIEENGKMLIMNGSRHPLIETNILIVNNFIPNDVHMNKDNKRLNIITGPNMGGKSTYIRQIALICLMAHIGCFVPCTYAKIPIFSQIMCRVGSSDIQLKGISTFFSEMIEISAIIKNADENSLVIIDELGRGTSTYEGFGISWSIGNYLLNNIKCFCLFATHFHEMSNLEEEYEGVINNHVGAKIDPVTNKISFLYEIKKGYADKSYGVQVAQIAKLPKNVIDKAFEKSKELESVENRYYFKSQLKSTTNKPDEQKTQTYAVTKNILQQLFTTNEQKDFVASVQNHMSTLKQLISQM
ncbi:DNA mismatch repair protein MSH2, putative [Hepatocystis sp. ex Piliocolobus tephrosceles]|nr:DNA mismatch repair protein MSH2, putative [Hepatocystis sp. ex Piliocolobus tephrosceles]